MPKYLTIHQENNVDRITLESRWTEIAKDSRAKWQMTLFNTDLGTRYCEWDASNKEHIVEIFKDLGIKWSEIIEVEVTAAPEWHLWEMESREGSTNCWENLLCGRELGGDRATELGVCPAAVDSPYDGRNRGQFAGRCCWKVVGTFCEGRAQTDHAEKMRDCAMCDFFQRVRKEEGTRFEP
jgi:Nickel responsive protein SCO4226-like